MKFLHTSDLHLGKILNDVSLLEDQEYILDEIIRIAEEEKVEGILIAGDVYDRAAPGEGAVKLYDNFINKANAKGIKLYISAGNHDNIIRLSVYNKLIEAAGIYISGEYDGEIKPIKCENGEETVNIYLLPFIKPATVKNLGEKSVKSYNDALKNAIDKIKVKTNEVNILLSHQYITGTDRCDSETQVGGLDNVDASNYKKFDYVALGHIHNHYYIDNDNKNIINYSGTPLKYSKSEADNKKSVTIVEIKDKKTKIKTYEIELKPKREMHILRGTFEEIISDNVRESVNTDDYFYIELTQRISTKAENDTLKEIYPHILNVDVMNTSGKGVDIKKLGDVNSLDTFTLFEKFYEESIHESLNNEQKEIIRDLINEVWEED